MKKNLLWITIMGIALTLTGCGNQPKANKKIVNGNYTYYDKFNRETTVTEHKNGKPNGVGRTHTAKGLLIEEKHFKDGLKHGEARKWYKQNGQLMQLAHYKNGKLDGEYKSWFYNGKLRTVETYKNGQEEGVASYYFDDGKLKVRRLWKNGKEVKGVYAKEVVEKRDMTEFNKLLEKSRAEKRAYAAKAGEREAKRRQKIKYDACKYIATINLDESKLLLHEKNNEALDVCNNGWRPGLKWFN